ncbi:MFS transporter [Brevibacillus ginsengisoli]|uniref:MFS transporter n=1 Tax=Brevibacillus ginsengisoli TaxID=363854 RepID=UPI003CF10C05
MPMTNNHLLSNRTFIVLLITALFMHLATYLVIPLFPIFLEKTSHFSLSEVGLVLGVGSVAFQLGSLSGGFLSDRWGKRNVMLVGTLIQMVAMVGYSQSSLYVWFLLFSGLNGVGTGFLAPTLKAMISQVVDETERTTAFSWRGIAANLGIILGGLLITVFALGATKKIFLYSAGTLAVLAVLTFFALPNDRCQGEQCKPIPLSEYKEILKHRSFLFFSGVSLFIWALYAQLALFLPLRADYVLHSTASIGLIWTINSIVVVLFQGPISRFVLQRINPYIALVVGTGFLGAGLFFLGWSSNFVSISASAITFIVGEMLFLPVLDSLVGHFASPKWMGAYFGIANVVSGIGSAIGNISGGAIMQRFGGVGSQIPWLIYGFLTVLIVAILGLFAAYAMRRHHGNRYKLTHREKAK